MVEPEVEAPALETPDIIGLEEAEEAGAEAAIEEDEEIVDLGDDAEEIPAADDDNAFLEEEGVADVSGIVRTPGEESEAVVQLNTLIAPLQEGPPVATGSS